MTKNEGIFPTAKSVRKLLYLVDGHPENGQIPIPNWAKIRNQLAIRFEEIPLWPDRKAASSQVGTDPQT
ncbi:MAG: hypothetical protein H6644_13155 [Caldilineaceae bacterium]|nr:hypothetical protein [Caldilineaceae bacterium]